MGMAMSVVLVRRLTCARLSSYWDIYILLFYRTGRGRTSAAPAGITLSPPKVRKTDRLERKTGFILEISRIFPTGQMPTTVAGDGKFRECSAVTSDVLL
jgi:hypothetical protein